MNDDKIEKILKDIGGEEVPADIQKIAQETSNEFSKSLKKPPKTHLLELIMRSRTIKLAAAAVIIIAVLLGLPFFGGKTTGVALADVLAKVEQATAYMYKMNMRMTGSMGENMPAMDQDIEATMIVSNDFGIKTETVTVDGNTGEKSTHTSYVIPHEGIAVTLMPEKKKYVEIKFGGDWLAKMKQQNNDPREMIKQMMGCKYTELGRSTIDGVEVDGFLTTDPAAMAGIADNVKITLWVDAEKWLPVRHEIDFGMGDKLKVHGVVSEYQWDVPVVKSEFDPVIPEDFTPFSTEGFQMPKLSEEGLIEGLKLFAELSGSYPKNLSMMELAQEITGLANSQGLKDRIEKLKEEMEQAGELEKDEFMARSTQITMPLTSPGMFYMMLAQGKQEPVYYGETVGPDDVEAVLLRWKISDDQYRVIFGDLSAMDVTAEKLDELEK